MINSRTYFAVVYAIFAAWLLIILTCLFLAFRRRNWWWGLAGLLVAVLGHAGFRSFEAWLAG